MASSAAGIPAARDNDDAIGLRLLEPADTVTLDRLAQRWFHHQIRVFCRRPKGLDLGPALPGRLRGGWGRQLMAGASAEALAGHPCHWQPPCAFDVLFRSRPNLGGLEMPKPYVLTAEAMGEDIAVTLTLFGFATDWCDSAAEALVRALRQGITTGDGRCLPLEPIERAIAAGEAVAVPEGARRVVLRFATPLQLRRGEAMIAEGPALMSSLANRVSGLARWQDARADADWRGLKAAAAELRYDLSGLRPVVWQRKSSRQPGRALPMAGLTGAVTIEGALDPFLPLLALGETAHVGSHAAIGLGRYTLHIDG